MVKFIHLRSCKQPENSVKHNQHLSCFPAVSRNILKAQRYYFGLSQFSSPAITNDDTALEKKEPFFLVFILE
jgi:hypothetical protein